MLTPVNVIPVRISSIAQLVNKSKVVGNPSIDMILKNVPKEVDTNSKCRITVIKYSNSNFNAERSLDS